jgi:predicted permease
MAAVFRVYCKGFMHDFGGDKRAPYLAARALFEDIRMHIPLSEFRYALRQLRKNPGFTTVAVLTLALGIGANSAIFSVVYAVLLRPLPFHDASRLVSIQTTEPGHHEGIGGVSYPSFLDWRAQDHAFEGMSAFNQRDFTLTGRGEPAHLTGAIASANLFSVLGIAPALGRGFLPNEDKPGTSPPIVLSHSLWQSRFAADQKVVGQNLTLDGKSFSVVGVMPAGFQFPVERTPMDFWTTIALDTRGSMPMTSQRGVAYLDVIGRLKAGLTPVTAQTEMAGIQAGLNHQYPENRPKGIRIVQELDAVVGEMRQALFILFGAVGLVLLIACVNLSNLSLARASSRSKEISVRKALGATQWMILRQLLVESMMLAAGGAALGLVFASWSIQLLTRLAPGELPRVMDSGLDLPVLAFTATVALFTSIILGLIPAFQGNQGELGASMKEDSRSGTESRVRRRLRSGLIVTEMAFAIVLLVGAGLLLRSLLSLEKVDPGFAKDHVVTFGLDLTYDHAHKVDFYNKLLAKIRATPGVGSASAALPLPLEADDLKTSFDVEGHPMKQSERPVTTLHIIDRDYFHTMKIPLLRGRDFNLQDDVSGATPGVIISQRLAQQVFPGEDPVGRRIRPGIGTGDSDAPFRVVVGVVGDVKAEGLGAASIAESYVPYSQLPMMDMSVVVRSEIPPADLVPALTREVQALDPSLPLLHVKTLDDYVSDSVGGTRFEAVLLGIFGGLAFLLTAVGLYGVISYTVVRRTRELGIRLALGANRKAITKMIVRNGTLLACTGVAIGLAAAFLLTRLVAGLLYGVGPTDPLTFVCAPIALIAIAVLASYIPARRAANVDPMVTLRQE